MLSSLPIVLRVPKSNISVEEKRPGAVEWNKTTFMKMSPTSLHHYRQDLITSIICTTKALMNRKKSTLINPKKHSSPLPAVTSTSTGKISSSWLGAGWLALMRIKAVWFDATLPTKLTLMSAFVSYGWISCVRKHTILSNYLHWQSRTWMHV